MRGKPLVAPVCYELSITRWQWWAVYLGGCNGGCLWVRCANGRAPTCDVVLVVVCSLIFCCRWAMMPRSLVWAREQSLLSRVIAVRVSCRRVVLIISGILWPLRFIVAAMEGRTLASAVAMSDAVSSRVVPTWPMGMQPGSTLSQYRRSLVTRDLYLSVFSLSSLWQPRSLQN
jgi:hypothetical protein